MTKRELQKMLEPVPPEKASIEWTLETDVDGKSGQLKFKSDLKMNSGDFIIALADWIEEFANAIYKQNGMN